MLENRLTHNVLLAVAALLCAAGMVLMAFGIFASYCLKEDSRMALGVCGFGGLSIIGGMWVGSYIKRRMRT